MESHLPSKQIVSEVYGIYENSVTELIHEVTSTFMDADATSRRLSEPVVPSLTEAMREQQSLDMFNFCATASTSSLGHACQIYAGQSSNVDQSSVKHKRPSSAPAMRPQPSRQQQQQEWRQCISVDEDVLSQPSATAQGTEGHKGNQHSSGRKDHNSHSNDIPVGAFNGCASSCSTRPPSAGSTSRQTVSSMRPQSAGSTRPGSAGSMRPQSAVSTRPGSPGSMRPQSAGSTRPGSAGRRYQCTTSKDSMKSSRPSSPPRLPVGAAKKKPPVWPPPPVHVRVGPAPRRGQASNYVLWQRHKSQEDEVNKKFIQLAMHEREEFEKQRDEDEKANHDIVEAMHGLFQKTTTGITQKRGSLLGLKLQRMQDRATDIVPDSDEELDMDPDSPHGRISPHRRVSQNESASQKGTASNPLIVKRRKYLNKVPSTSTSRAVAGKVEARPRGALRVAQIVRLKTVALRAHRRVSQAEHLKLLAASVIDGKGNLSADEVQDIRGIFNRLAGEASTSRLGENRSSIGVKAWRELLADFGLIPKTHEEKVIVSQVLDQRFTALFGSQDSGQNRHMVWAELELDFNLTIVLVHEVRHAIEAHMRQKLWEFFLKHDEDHNGVLDHKEALNALAYFQICPDDDDEVNDLLITLCVIDKDGTGIDFEEFRRLIHCVREYLAHKTRKLQREIARDCGLNAEVFEILRDDLVSLRHMFLKHDENENGQLDPHEVRKILMDLGLSPRTFGERKQFEAYFASLGTDGGLDLSGFILLVAKLRAYNENQWKENVHHIFQQADKDHSQVLEGHEIGNVLTKLGLNPTSAAEQREIAMIVEDADVDGSGSLDIQEFEVVAQRVWERLRTCQKDQDEKLALEMGFTSERFDDLRELFEKLEDLAGFGGVSIMEVRKVVHFMKLPMSSDALRTLFAQVEEMHKPQKGGDKRPSLVAGRHGLVRTSEGRLTLPQFLQLMWILERGHVNLQTGKPLGDTEVPAVMASASMFKRAPIDVKEKAYYTIMIN
eukprot:gnl/MRDRNA2_/MRDRNA2_73549_c0_seq1.p1 gnl/MRDRNA2_/MRDRNA2_73549_c0~~gnl/MRDRNA2_/MRDRNA2_73549_c0_seq1.p1  ORF type:complete len:1092 (+),score=218.15 gnl/MRDRNA2_/MRDRNA2_73549_c0_seq1:269-3277(+)